MSTYSIYPKQFNDANYKLQSDSCFVIMPFSDDMNNTYMIIDTVASSMNIKCTRADNVSTTSEPILNKICTQIKQAYFIIVDITNLNPNVFYELGIAHVLRDASKVLIIKEKGTKCPSDIGHLHYYEYSKSDLTRLKENITKFFSENNILEDLQGVLNFLDLLPKDHALAQKFVVSVSTCTGTDMDCLILILNNQITQSQQPQVSQILKKLTNELCSLKDSDMMHSLYSKLILTVVTKTVGVCDIFDYAETVLEGKYSNLSANWVADCSTILLENPNYVQNAIRWMMEYLKQSSPAAFDIAKYKIELGLIKARSELVDHTLVKELKSDNKTLVEHCAKLIKERKTYKAIPALLELIRIDENPYVVRSCVDALVAMAPLETLINARGILNARADFIEAYHFISKHQITLETQISKLQNASNC